MIPALILAMLGSAPDATDVLQVAQIEAKKSKRNVLVIFHASWCPWCRRFDAMLANPRLVPAFRRSYVVAKITLREREAKRALENPGWEPIMLNYRGAADKDIPYVVVTDSAGVKLATSYRGEAVKIPDNAGFPSTSIEIDAFMQMIRDTGRGFTAMDRRALEGYLREIAKLTAKS